ncbi:MAG: FAD-dependent thymidylate synthase [Christensenellaceae bacterium]|nr:FAD-dependent thymidylate synthase [Christensenellaceae bacterium]
MPRVDLAVTLLSVTSKGEELSALAARLCYSPDTVDELKQKVSEKKQSAFLKGVVSSGHLSVIEHISFTFGVEGVSRSLLAQLTRHRIASYSVQSQRYVSLADGFNYIIPPKIAALGDGAIEEYESQMAQIQSWYKSWQDRLEKGEGGNEDARFVLPNACETRLVVTMNARELLHFFKLRCCNRAQWEIRNMADAMLKICRQEIPAIFNDAGPSCILGPCPEGSRTCGQIKEVREKYKVTKD